MIIPIKKIILEFNLEKTISSSFRRYMDQNKTPTFTQKYIKNIQPKTTHEKPDEIGSSIYDSNGSIKDSYNLAKLEESLK